MTLRHTHAPWALDLVVEMDRHASGFCGAFFRASPERRQVIAAYLAAKPLAQSGMEESGRFLLNADHRSILAAAYDEAVPQGMRGALRRAGGIVQEERFYRLLHRLLDRPDHRQIVRSISRLRSLSLVRLLVLRMLPEPICRANVIEMIDSFREARDVATGFRLLIARGVEPESLASAIRQVRSEHEFSKVWRTWLLKAHAPDHPVPASDWYRPVTTGSELHKIAVRYRNCARRYIPDLLDGNAGHAFAEARHTAGGAVVHLVRKNDRWFLEGLFGSRNARPGRALRALVEDYLADHGIVIEQARPRKQTEWDALRRLSAAALFQVTFD